MASRCLLVVVGASGGVGASVLAAAVAVRAAAAGLTVALVDGCPVGGGLDVAVGAEQEDGIRWADLGRLVGSADGQALLSRLPSAEGVPVLSFGRDGGEPPAEVASAVMTALAEECQLVVVDASAAGGPVTETALSLADGVVAVAGDGMRQLAALSVVARGLARGAGKPGAAMGVCLRGTARAVGPVARVVESELRWPVICAVGEDRGVQADLAHGVPPGSRGGGEVVRAAEELLGWAVLRDRGAA